MNNNNKPNAAGGKGKKLITTRLADDVWAAIHQMGVELNTSASVPTPDHPQSLTAPSTSIHPTANSTLVNKEEDENLPEADYTDWDNQDEAIALEERLAVVMDWDVTGGVQLSVPGYRLKAAMAQGGNLSYPQNLYLGSYTLGHITIHAEIEWDFDEHAGKLVEDEDGLFIQPSYGVLRISLDDPGPYFNDEMRLQVYLPRTYFEPPELSLPVTLLEYSSPWLALTPGVAAEFPVRLEHLAHITELTLNWSDSREPSAPNSNPEEPIARNLPWQTLLTLSTRAITALRAIKFSPDGRNVAIGGEDGQVRIINLEQKRVYKTFDVQKQLGAVQALDYSPDGKRLSVGGTSGGLVVYDIKEGKSVRHTHHTEAINAIEFSPDGQALAIGVNDGMVRILGEADYRQLRVHRHRNIAVNSLAFSPNGKQLALGYNDQAIVLKSLESWQERDNIVYKGHKDVVTSVAFNPNNRQLASGCLDASIRFWQNDGSQQHQEVHSHQAGVRSLTYNTTGTLLASGSDDFTIKLWDSATGELEKTLKGHQSQVNAVCFNSQGTQLASCDEDGLAVIWDVATGQPLLCFDVVDPRLQEVGPEGIAGQLSLSRYQQALHRAKLLQKSQQWITSPNLRWLDKGVELQLKATSISSRIVRLRLKLAVIAETNTDNWFNLDTGFDLRVRSHVTHRLLLKTSLQVDEEASLPLLYLPSATGDLSNSFDFLLS